MKQAKDLSPPEPRQTRQIFGKTAPRIAWSKILKKGVLRIPRTRNPKATRNAAYNWARRKGWRVSVLVGPKYIEVFLVL